MQQPRSGDRNGQSVADAQHAWETGSLARVLDRYPERRERFASTSVETKRLYIRIRGEAGSAVQ